jgi:hypothetical protein
LRSESPHLTQWDETAGGTLAVLVTSSPPFSRATTSALQAQEAWYATEALGRSGCRRWLGRGDEPVWRYLAARGCCRNFFECSEFTIRLPSPVVISLHRIAQVP